MKATSRNGDSVVIDCDHCGVRGHGCHGCVMSVLLDPRPQLLPEEVEAVDVLAAVGLVGPLHLALISLPLPCPGTEGAPQGHPHSGRYSA